MKFYYYSIQNQIDYKQYIGITEHYEKRKTQHWQKLQNNSHPNPRLQHAVNKYGIENFTFSIIDEKEYNCKEDGYLYEQQLIEQYDTLNTGYNCNPGGFWSGPQARFTKEQVFYIKAACMYNAKVCGIISRFYGCSIDIIAGIRAKRNYTAWGEEFDQLPNDQKLKIYNDFCELTDFDNWKNKAYIKPTRRKYTKEEIFIMLYWCETKFTTAKAICDTLGIKYPNNPNYRCANKFRNLREGKVYQDYKSEYDKLDILEKQKIERLYAERHIENLVNCGEPLT